MCLKRLKTYSVILFVIIMFGVMLSGCGSVNGLKIEGTDISSEKVTGTLISSDRHSWYGDGYIAGKADDENIMYTAFESGKLRNIDIIEKEITVTFFDREVTVSLILQDADDDMRIIDQNVQYDVKENDEEVYGGDIYIEFLRLGSSSEDFLLYAGVKQSDEVSQCGIVSVDDGLTELLVTEDIEQYADKISNIIVSDDKKYIFYAGEKEGSIVCLKKERDTGVVTELLKKAGIEAEEIELQKFNDSLNIFIDHKQLRKMEMSDKEPELLIERSGSVFFQSTMGRYIIYGHNNEIQKLFDLETCEYIELPMTFDKENMDAICNQSNTKIMFVNVNDFYDDKLSDVEKEMYIFDIETKDMSSNIYNTSDLSHVVSISWFDDDRIIIQGENGNKDYYEILEDKDEK